MIIQHLAIENGWEGPEIVENPKTLILGSFNPFNTNINRNADYYYGRSTNHFWKSIARNLNLHEDYFCNNWDRKLEIMNKYQFCFQDIIDSIEIDFVDNQIDNDVILNNFMSAKIFKEFSDQVLFTSTTTYKGFKIRVKRNYNENVIQTLRTGSIKNIIHTMGNTTINQNFRTNWLENGLGGLGFQGYINRILNQGVNFNPISYSPSGRAVKGGGENYINFLDNWTNTNLILR
ncbi:MULTISPECIES: hypothetical protein [unclassified Flavobacterium]|jgi:hypothetical protein|uniref:hypothetical protein n=1 Tax=unclassified Flavobacterium TaxID=196869 RepID=UPI0025B9243C|nr:MULTISPECIES: hypothetical protein [unclassified Flavobacterium]